MAIFVDKVQQFDINGHKIGSEHIGSCVTFSLDGTQFALCNKSTVMVHNSKSGEMMKKFHMSSHTHTAKHCCFSPDGSLIAVGVDSSAYVWDITSSNPHLIETFIGHAQEITGLIFSSPSSLISTSEDRSIKFWQIGNSSTEPTEPDSTSATYHQGGVKSITLQAIDGVTITSDLDGVIRVWDILTGCCKESYQTPARGFQKGDVRLIDGRLVIAWYLDGNISVWDVTKQELLLTTARQLYMQLKISGDGSTIFCMNWNSVSALSIQTGEEISQVEFDHGYSKGSLAVEGSRVFLRLISMHGNEWDYEVLDSFTQLSNKPPTKVHPGGGILWDIGSSKVQDIPGGKVLFQLNAGLGRPIDAQWMDQYLVICFASGKVLVLDFSYALL